ncbi:MAG: hypothetical protein [Podoviridae sp. ctLUJ1]|nr:MAG: hypothetical protein [Podoviridae sp. ctLUJ1]
MPNTNTAVGNSSNYGLWGNAPYNTPTAATPDFWGNSNMLTPESLMTAFNQQNGIGGDFGNVPAVEGMSMFSPQQQQPSFWKNAELFGTIGKGLQGLSAVGGTVLGFQQLNEAKDQAAFQKEAFWLNYNQQLEDRQEAARRRQSAAAVSKG